MKIIHPKNLSNEDLIESLIYNLRRDPSKDVSIIVDELKRRLSDPANKNSPCPECGAESEDTHYRECPHNRAR